MKKALMNSFIASNKRFLIGVSAIIGTGVFLIPAPAGASSTTVSSQVGAVISSETASSPVTINLTPTAAGVQTTASGTETVSTNDSAGYTLKIAETSASQDLVGVGNASNKLLATTGTPASPIALTAGKWGWRADGIGGFGAGPTSAINSTSIGAITYAAVPATASPYTVRSTATTASSDVNTFWYSAAANTSQPSDTYTNSVTYTVTAN